VPRSFELSTALLEYLDLFLQGDAAPLPLRVAHYMIMKMVEIYNIAAQLYYCWQTHIKTIAPRAPLTYLSLKRRRFVTSYVQPVIQHKCSGMAKGTSRVIKRH